MALPPSSPRLPSPPPPTEIQIGPKSPSLGLSGEHDNAIEQSILNANAARRIHPGTKAAEMAAGPPLIPLMELDSAFQLQEHLKALHYHHTKPSDTAHLVPISRSTAPLISTPPAGVDRDLWLYELCRFLINKCNDLIVGFLFDSPPCSSTTCPEMRASEWQFLCAVHDAPKSCCAIDYCCHTLDWATNIVTSQKIFPSRLSLGDGGATEGGGPGFKHLINIFRRLHRIFAHAWFQHRGVFWQVEGQSGLYVLFKTVCDSYDLLPPENYKLPPEAEGLQEVTEPKVIPVILKHDTTLAKNVDDVVAKQEEPDFVSVGRTNTRRHIRSSPSTGSAVTTVLEADFEEDGGDHGRGVPNIETGKDLDLSTMMMKDMKISEPNQDFNIAQDVQLAEIGQISVKKSDVVEDKSDAEPNPSSNPELQLNPAIIETGADDQQADKSEVKMKSEEGLNKANESTEEMAALYKSSHADTPEHASVVHKVNIDDQPVSQDASATKGEEEEALEK